MTFNIFRRRTPTKRGAASRSLFSYVSEMYALPDDLTTRHVIHGRQGFAQDAERIGGYFRSAVARHNAETANR